MTHPKTQALLKKINYIEADLDIQRQILFSIPSAEKAEIEKVIGLIAARKKEIDTLRQKLRELDPAEYERILVFEVTVDKFKKIAAASPFQAIVNRNINEECTLALQNGEPLECLIKACDEIGNWTVITLEGEIRQFPAGEVAEKAPPKTTH
jgi:biotin-(acetyl-CoA carboxylase) ligase